MLFTIYMYDWKEIFKLTPSESVIISTLHTAIEKLNKERDFCGLSNDHLAKMAHVCRKTVVRALKHFKELGIIRIDKAGSPWRQIRLTELFYEKTGDSAPDPEKGPQGDDRGAETVQEEQARRIKALEKQIEELKEVCAALSAAMPKYEFEAYTGPLYNAIPELKSLPERDKIRIDKQLGPLYLAFVREDGRGFNMLWTHFSYLRGQKARILRASDPVSYLRACFISYKKRLEPRDPLAVLKYQPPKAPAKPEQCENLDDLAALFESDDF